MSSVDNRAVHMTFDNASFEKNLADTMKSMDSLKKSLDFTNAKRSFSELGDVTRGFSLGGLASSVEGVSGKFLALSTIAITTLANIVDRAVDAGIRVAKSFTIAPITEGFSDYNAKLTSVQTITNATGESLETVSGFFDQLDEYADKTVFNLSDMTSAFAKFTNAGIDMDVAIPAIKGIANMTALAGQGADAAAIGMYNLSQSLAGGFLTTTDYKSLNLANIATKQWKDYMIQAAVAAGTLKQTGEDSFEVLNDGSNTVANSAQLFNNELSRGWATADILIDVLGDFGDTSTDIGKKAQAAAQDVKSLPMMMDTLKAAVGTGWTDSFEIILGNLDESKALFTDFTNSIGAALEKNSEWRNNLLQGWKDLGGRTKLIEGIKNTFSGLSEIVGAISRAFSHIFPPVTSQLLFDLTEKFSNFAESLRLNQDQLYKISGYFTSFFAVIKIGIEIVRGVVGVIVDLFQHFAGGNSDAVVGFMDKLSDGVFKLYYALVKGGGLDKFFAAITEKLISFGESLKNPGKFLADIADEIKNFFKGIDFGSFDGLTEAFDRVKNEFIKIKDFIVGVVEDIFGINIDIHVPEGLKDFFKNIFGNVDDNTSNSIDISGGFDRISGALETMWDIAKNVGDAIGTVFDVLGDIGSWVLDAGEAVIDFFKNLGPNLQDFIMSDEFDKLLQFMQSLGVLMGGAGVGKIAKDGLQVDLTGGSLTGLGNLFKMISDMGPSVKKNIEGLTGVFKSMSLEIKAKALLKIAEAIGLITASVLVLSFIDPDALAKSLTALAVGFGQLIGAMALLNTAGGPKSAVGTATTAGSMIAIAGAVLILSAAATVMAQLDWEEIGKGLTGVTGLLLVMAGASKILQGSSGSLIAAGVGMTAIGVAVTILAGAMKIFATMSWEDIGKGLTAVAGGLLIMAGALQLMPATTILIGPGLVAVGFALTELGAALLIFATMSWEDIGKGMTVLAGGLLIIAGAMNLMPASSILTGPGLIAIATGLTILGGALKVFATMSWEEIGKSMTVLASSLLILSGAMALMSGGIPGAIAVGIMAGSLLLLNKALKEFAKMSWKELGKGLGVMAAALGALGLAALALSATGAIAALFLLGIALVALGAGFALIGVGATLVAEALQVLAAAGTAGIDVLMYAIDQLLLRLPEMARGFAEAILSLADVILEAAPGLIEKLSAIIGQLLDLIADNADNFGGAALAWITAMLQVMRDSSPDLVKTGFQLLLDFLHGVESNIKEITATTVKIVIAFLEGLAENAYKFANAGTEVVVQFLKGLNENVADIVEEALKFVLNVVEGITRNIDDVVTAAIDIIEAFNKGLSENVDDVIKSGAMFVLKLIAGIADSANLIVTQGTLALISFISGIGSNLVLLANAAFEVVIEFLHGIADAIRDNDQEIHDAAFDLIEALAEGMVTAILGDKIQGLLKDVGVKAVKAIWHGATDWALAHSPSRRFMELGDWIGQGLAIGLDDNNDGAASGESLVKRTYSTMQDSINAMALRVQGMKEFNPTITPVLDLTQVQDSANGINGLLANQSLTAGVSLQAANQLLAETSQSQEEPQKEEPVRQLSFTQINNSPEALSTAVVYKRTRSQIEMAKKELENV